MSFCCTAIGRIGVMGLVNIHLSAAQRYALERARKSHRRSYTTSTAFVMKPDGNSALSNRR